MTERKLILEIEEMIDSLKLEILSKQYLLDQLLSNQEEENKEDEEDSL